MKPVHVVWEDCSEADIGPWVDRASAPPAEVIVFKQVGFLLEMTAAEVILTSCIGEHQMGVRTRIPAGMVRSIVELIDGTALSIPKKRKRTK